MIGRGNGDSTANVLHFRSLLANHRRITESLLTNRAIVGISMAKDNQGMQTGFQRTPGITASRFQDLLEAAPDAMLLVDQAGKIAQVNSQTEKLFGYRRNEVLGRDVEVLLPPRFRERHQRHRMSFVAEPRVRPMGAKLELFGLSKAGTEFPVEVSLSPIATQRGVLVIVAIRDITERKLLDQERLTLAAIVESSEDAIISTTLDAIITGWNAGAERIYGYKAEEAVGRPIYILIPADLWDEERRILEKLMAGERIQHYETIRVTKAGEKVNVSLTISPIKDSTGRTVGVSKIARDITERKRAEEALRLSEERLRLAQQAARIGTFDWDIRAGVNTWTPELEAMYGLSRGSFGGTQSAFENLVSPDDRARVIGLNDWALKTGQPTRGEWRVLWPDGTVHWLAGSWQVFMDERGRPSRMIGVNIDVTERKLAEEALRENDQWLRLAMQAGRMYAYDWNVTTNVVERSSEHIEILGLTKPLRLPHHHFVDRIHPDDRPRFLAAIARLTPENPTGEVTYRALALDDTPVWLKSNGRGLFDGEGKLLRVIGMVVDITDIKRAEEALAGIAGRLLEAQEQERTRISRDLHDDINQRLALLALELEQLRAKPSEVQRRAQELQQRVIDIANDVQSLAHDLHSSKLEYLGVVAGIKSWCREFAERQRVEIDLTTDVPGVLPQEIGVVLLRVLQEAVNNAVRHSGIKRIEAQLREDRGEVHLIVRDFGKGFDVEAAKGKGLGLISMRERVRLVNGTIEIESQLKSGTTIHAHVPLKSEADTRRAAV
jgi:PAS domain S-box-containing protein